MKLLAKQLVEAIGCTEEDAAVSVEPLNITIERYDIKTVEQVASFLAQVAYESARLSQLEENLNYSDLALANTWPQRYGIKLSDGSYKKIMVGGRQKIAPNELAKALHRKPEQIANLTYANRLGNGPESTGDGWKYRGRGYIMVTGKDNYERCGVHLRLNLIQYPDSLTTPMYAALSSGWFWRNNKLNRKAENISVVTRLVSGSYVTAKKREEMYKKIKEVLLNG